MRAQRGIVNFDIKTGNYEAAEAGIETLLTKYADHDDLPQAFYWLGNDYLDARQYDKAVECYQYVIDNRPESNAAMSSWAGIGRVYVRRGNDEAVQGAIDIIIADFNDNPGVAEGLSSLAEEYFYKKDYRKAIDIWDLILSSYPGEGPDLVPYLLASSHERLKEYVTAVKYYEQSVAEYPNCKYAWRVPYRLGLVYRELRDNERALYWFEQQSVLYSNESTSRLTFEPAVTEVDYDIDEDGALTYDNSAESSAIKAEVGTTGYDFHVYVVYSISGITSTGGEVIGFADSPGKHAHVESSVSMNTVAHELGHALDAGGDLTSEDGDTENLMSYHSGGSGWRLRKYQWDTCNTYVPPE